MNAAAHRTKETAPHIVRETLKRMERGVDFVGGGEGEQWGRTEVACSYVQFWRQNLYHPTTPYPQHTHDSNLSDSFS